MVFDLLPREDIIGISLVATGGAQSARMAQWLGCMGVFSLRLFINNLPSLEHPATGCHCSCYSLGVPPSTQLATLTPSAELGVCHTPVFLCNLWIPGIPPSPICWILRLPPWKTAHLLCGIQVPGSANGKKATLAAELGWTSTP